MVLRRAEQGQAVADFGREPAGAVLLLLGVFIGGPLACSGAMQDNSWYGYYYENLQTDAPGAQSRPFASAQECRRVMLEYTRRSAPMAGFACARGCPPARGGLVADCRQVAR